MASTQHYTQVLKAECLTSKLGCRPQGVFATAKSQPQAAQMGRKQPSNLIIGCSEETQIWIWSTCSFTDVLMSPNNRVIEVVPAVSARPFGWVCGVAPQRVR